MIRKNNGSELVFMNHCITVFQYPASAEWAEKKKHKKKTRRAKMNTQVQERNHR